MSAKPASASRRESSRDRRPSPRPAAGSPQLEAFRAKGIEVLLLTDRIEFAMYVGFGAFTGIYSRYEPTRARFRRQLLAGAMLTVCVTIGAAVAQLAPKMPETLSSWVVILVGALVAAAAAGPRARRR